MFEYYHLNHFTLFDHQFKTLLIFNNKYICLSMKVLSLAMAFIFAALAVAGSADESYGNKLAERGV